MPGGANKVSLMEAQRNYQDFGACDQHGRKYVRPPAEDEPLDPAWRPIDLTRDSFEDWAAEDRAPWPGNSTGPRPGSTWPRRGQRGFYDRGRGAWSFGRGSVSSLKKIAVRRAELDELAEALAKQLAEVDAEREELAVAERVLRRLYEQEAEAATAGQEAGAPQRVQVAGRSVLKVPHRGEVADASALPVDYQRMLKIVQVAGGPVMVKDVGAELGVEVAVPGRLEPLRGKLSKLADRGRLHKLPNGTFTQCPYRAFTASGRSTCAVSPDDLVSSAAARSVSAMPRKGAPPEISADEPRTVHATPGDGRVLCPARSLPVAKSRPRGLAHAPAAVLSVSRCLPAERSRPGSRRSPRSRQSPRSRRWTG
ncbi:CPCC family cysteine-rich protein [Streptomyces sp. LN549]|uniref:CPCC family cysteine-rich protein n=1 Tax=Streptomyces sp. LN549 TaxID=3112979 RepID=UPI00372125AF